MKLVTDPAKILHQVAKPVTQFDDTLRKTVQELRAAMTDWKGMGLAAPQVGLSLALFVMEYQAEKEEDCIPFIAFCNPHITWHSHQTAVMTEGCLSLPGLEGDVIRPKRLKLRAQTPDGETVRLQASGLIARIIQHETDHLNGILYPERLVPGTTTRPISNDNQTTVS